MREITPAARPLGARTPGRAALSGPALLAASLSLAWLAGCAGQVSMFPNSDPALRKKPAQFAADAAKRSYPADLPRGGESVGRAQVGYSLNVLEVSNLSDADWNDAEIWVNKRYVVSLPKVVAGAPRVTSINFQMLYDERGQHFPTNNTKTLVQSVELVKDGKVYDIPFKMAD